MIQRLVVILAGALLCLTSLGAEAAPRSRIARDDGTAKIVVYDSLCDEDNSLECLIAEIGCAGPSDFYATLYNLDAKQTATVFTKSAGNASVSVGGARFGLRVSKVALSDYTFNWDVTALGLEKPADIWRTIWGATEIQLQAGTKSAVLKRGDIEEAGFRDVVSTCAASP